MDERWYGWVQENLDRGANPEEILAVLLKEKFRLRDMRRSMGERFPAHSPMLGDLRPARYVDHRALANIRITRMAGTKGVKRVDTDQAQLYTVENFLTAKECDTLFDIIESNLVAPVITDYTADPDFRTGFTCHLAHMGHPYVEKIEAKISQKMGIHTAYGEAIQSQTYGVGHQFKEHRDFMEPGEPQFYKFAGLEGNRTWTCMIYLRDTEAGGGTHFPHLDLTFYPKKGRALIWNNLYADGTPNYDTAHCGLPVEKGYKAIITKFFRERSTVPMLLRD